MSVNVKKVFHIKHKIITACVICGLLFYGGISLSHAKNVQSYHPNLQLLSYRNTLQHNLNQLGEQDADRARVKYNHKNHQLIFLIEDYDSIRPFERNIAQHQTNQFRKHTHTKYITYSIHVLPSAIKEHLTQIKENKEQIAENKKLVREQKIQAQREAKKKQQDAIRAKKQKIQKAKQKQAEQRKKQQQKHKNKSQKKHTPNHHKK